MENVLLLTVWILQQYMIHLSEDGVKVVKSNGTDGEYQIYTAGIYIITEVKGFFNLIWDNKTSLTVQLHPKFKVSITPNHILHLPVHPLNLMCTWSLWQGKVCGLCGNFDDNANNDFMKYNGEVVTDPEDFGKSWRVDPKCQDKTNMMEPCEINLHRRALAEKRCRIINSDVFKECNAAVSIHIIIFRIQVIFKGLLFLNLQILWSDQWQTAEILKQFGETYLNS